MRYHANSFVAAQRWLHGRALATSSIFVACIFAVLLMLLSTQPDAPMLDDAPLRIVDVSPEPEPIVPPPPPVVEMQPQPAVEVGSPEGGTPRAAPAPRLTLPEPVIRLPVDQLPAVQHQSLVSRFDGVAFGSVNGLGGTGEGSGAGNGNGAGSGGTGSDVGAQRLTVRWAPGMNHAAIFQRHFPKRAKASRTAGAAKLVCEALEGDRVRNCQLVAEYPRGWGFGQAALDASPEYRVQVLDSSGARVYGRDVTLGVEFLPRNPKPSAKKKASEQFYKTPVK